MWWRTAMPASVTNDHSQATRGLRGRGGRAVTTVSTRRENRRFGDGSAELVVGLGGLGDGGLGDRGLGAGGLGAVGLGDRGLGAGPGCWAWVLVLGAGPGCWAWVLWAWGRVRGSGRGR